MRNLRTASAVLVIALFLIYGAIFFQLRQPLLQGYSDFISFYTAGKILQRGAAHQLYDLGLQYEIQRAVAPQVSIRQAALPFVRPPFEAWLFLAFAYLPYGAAFVLWNLFSAAFLLGVAVLLRKQIPQLQGFSLAFTWLAIVSYFPVFVTILQGQDSILLLGIYVIVYTLLSRNAYFASGMVLGLGIIKFTLLLPFLLVFMVRRRWDVIVGFFLTSALLLLISVGTVGISAAWHYPQFLLNIDKVAKGVNVPTDMPNLRGLLAILVPSQFSHLTAVWLLAVVSLLLLALAARNWAPRLSDKTTHLQLGFSLNLVITILVSYHCHSFDLCLLVLPMALMTGLLLSGNELKSSRKLLAWALAVVAFSPIYIVIAFVTKYPALISVLLLFFAVAIGLASSQLKRQSLENTSVVGTSAV